jgi:hypothetical protein
VAPLAPPMPPNSGRFRVYGRTRAEARAKLAKARDAVEQGHPAKDSTPTLSFSLSHWCATTLAESARKPATRELNASMSKSHIAPSLGAIPLDKLKPSDVERLIVDVQSKGLPPSIIRSAYTVLRSALDGAVRDGLVARGGCASALAFAVVR